VSRYPRESTVNLQSINQSIKQSINQAINQSSNQSINILRLSKPNLDNIQLPCNQKSLVDDILSNHQKKLCRLNSSSTENTSFFSFFDFKSSKTSNWSSIFGAMLFSLYQRFLLHVITHNNVKLFTFNIRSFVVRFCISSGMIIPSV
jgi:hypothetical protein